MHNIQAICTHTYKYNKNITDIHTHTYKNTCKYIQKYIHQTSVQKVHMLFIRCCICMYVYVCMLYVCYMLNLEINPYVHVLHICAYMCIHLASFVSFEVNPYVHVLYVLAYMCIHVYTCIHM